jgi:hypothetical protein
MSRNWVVDIEPETSQGGSFVIRLGIKDPRTGKVLPLASTGGSIAELQKEVSAMKAELDRLIEEASQKIASLGKSGYGSSKAAPEQIWKEMESLATDDEMVRYFNDLGEMDRERVAEYVFSHVNMFKGRGPVFSERYDASSHILE